MATVDLDKMLEKIRNTQWALKDVDWEAPGAELITDEQWPRLRDFMADLVWIEHIGGHGEKRAHGNLAGDLYLLLCGRAAPRQCGNGADEALGHAGRERQNAATEQ